MNNWRVEYIVGPMDYPWHGAITVTAMDISEALEKAKLQLADVQAWIVSIAQED